MEGDFFGTLFLSTCLSAVAYLVVMIGVSGVEKTIEQRGRYKELREEITLRARLESGLMHRRDRVAREVRTHDNEVANLLKRRQTLNREIAEARSAGDQVIRLVGDEVSGNSCYLALMSNKYADPQRMSQDPRQSQIDSAWAVPQLIEVWTPSQGEARVLLEKRFPPSLGYVVTRLTNAPSPLEPVGGQKSPAASPA